MLKYIYLGSVVFTWVAMLNYGSALRNEALKMGVKRENLKVKLGFNDEVAYILMYALIILCPLINLFLAVCTIYPSRCREWEIDNYANQRMEQQEQEGD